MVTISMHFAEVDSVVEELRGQVRELQNKVDELSKIHMNDVVCIMYMLLD